MKRLIICLMVFLLPMLFGSKASGVCTPGTNWTASWTDSFSQTTYQLTAPCKVYLDIPFNITATVTDSSYPNDMVGSTWSIVDTPDGGSAATIASGNSVWTASGTWTRTVPRTYTGTALNHTIQFNFIDNGQGGGSHGLSGNVIGDLTVDPPPPTYGNINSADKYAWSETSGWLNFRPFFGGVTVYADHLEGYAWAENVGWIRLGSFSGGGSHTYLNTDQSNYGVNRSNSTLSGYGWSETSGWINFSPANGGVTVDPSTGSFDGYAWAENIGWIHFKNASPAYNVVFDNTAPSFTGTPSISGTGLVGDTLSLTDTGTTDPDGDTVTLSYQWKASGGVITGATNATYAITAAEAGKSITCTITAADTRGGSTPFTTAGKAAFCTYTLTPTAVTLASDAAAGQSFSVTTQNGCAWSAATTYGWLHTTSGGSGTGTGSYDLDANPETQRTGTITVAGRTITITQRMPKPAAATGLSATGAGPVNLVWTDNAVNETGYRVYRRRATESIWTKIADLGAGAVGHEDTAAVLDTTYFYIAQAWNSGGAANSNAARITTGTLTAPDSVEVDIEPGAAVADIQWKDNADTESGYEIWRRKVSDAGWTRAATVGADVTAYTDSGLATGNLWFYQICAITTGGGQACSALKGGNGPTGVAAAENPTAGVDLSWADNSVDESSFRVYRKKTTEMVWTALTTSIGADTEAYTDITAAEDVTYNYMVAAANGLGTVTSEVAGITTGTLAVPDRVTAVVEGAAANLTWRDNAATEEGYAVWRRHKGSGGWINRADLGAGVTGHTDSGLTAGVIYNYQICATTSAGGSACSTVAGINGPTGLTLSYSASTGVTLNWTDISTDEAGYRIARKAKTELIWVFIDETGADESTYTDATAITGTIYSYAVCGYNTDTAGACSAIKTITIP